MDVAFGLENLKRIEGKERSVLGIGNFDGLHPGHRKIISTVCDLARKNDAESVIITFDRHPRSIIDPEHKPGILMKLDDKLGGLNQLGVDLVLVLRCKHELLDMTPDQFINQVLIKYFKPVYIVEGPDFRFGHDRTGSIEQLLQVGPEFDFSAVKVSPVEVDLEGYGKTTVNSTLIRKLIKSGQVDLAARCLSRPYELAGNVIRGTGRGQTLGFPTANIDPGDQMLPAEGVYAGWAQFSGSDYAAAINIGPPATFDQTNPTVEAYILDFDGHIYQQQLRLKLIKFIRKIQKFDDTESLKKQIHADVRETRRILTQPHHYEN